MLLLLIVSLLGQAGEVGVHWETPEPGASTRVQAIWTWGEYRLTVHGEGGLLPWGFRRGGYGFLGIPQGFPSAQRPRCLALVESIFS